MNLKKGDKVVVIAGKEKGKEGTIMKVLRDENRVIIEDVNLVKHHQKSDGQNPGTIKDVEAPIHASNVMLIDPSTKEKTRIGKTINKKEKKVRVAKKSNKELDD